MAAKRFLRITALDLEIRDGVVTRFSMIRDGIETTEWPDLARQVAVDLERNREPGCICILPKRGGKLARHRKSCPKYRGRK
jgi:hypothetical protein